MGSRAKAAVTRPHPPHRHTTSKGAMSWLCPTTRPASVSIRASRWEAQVTLQTWRSTPPVRPHFRAKWPASPTSTPPAQSTARPCSVQPCYTAGHGDKRRRLWFKSNLIKKEKTFLCWDSESFTVNVRIWTRTEWNRALLDFFPPILKGSVTFVEEALVHKLRM